MNNINNTCIREKNVNGEREVKTPKNPWFGIT